MLLHEGASESKASLIGIVEDDSGVRQSISSLVRSNEGIRLVRGWLERK
jgi:hypothetical protein